MYLDITVTRLLYPFTIYICGYYQLGILYALAVTIFWLKSQQLAKQSKERYRRAQTEAALMHLLTSGLVPHMAGRKIIRSLLMLMPGVAEVIQTLRKDYHDPNVRKVRPVIAVPRRTARRPPPLLRVWHGNRIPPDGRTLHRTTANRRSKLKTRSKSLTLRRHDVQPNDKRDAHKHKLLSPSIAEEPCGRASSSDSNSDDFHFTAAHRLFNKTSINSHIPVRRPRKRDAKGPMGNPSTPNGRQSLSLSGDRPKSDHLADARSRSTSPRAFATHCVPPTTPPLSRRRRRGVKTRRHSTSSRRSSRSGSSVRRRASRRRRSSVSASMRKSRRSSGSVSRRQSSSSSGSRRQRRSSAGSNRSHIRHTSRSRRKSWSSASRSSASARDSQRQRCVSDNQRSDSAEERVEPSHDEVTNEAFNFLLPEWLRRCDDPTNHRGFINHIFASLWPSLRPALSLYLRNNYAADDYLELHKPAMLSALRTTAFDVGPKPPCLTSVRFYPFAEGHSDLVLDLGLSWAAVADVRIEARSGTLTTTFKMSELTFRGTLRLVLQNFVPIFPGFRSYTISFVEKPILDFRFKVMGMNVMELPGLATMLHKLIDDAISLQLVWPNKMGFATMDLEQGSLDQLSCPAPLTGVLRVTLVKGYNFKQRGSEVSSKAGPCSAYCTLNIGASKEQRSAVVPETIFPKWNERFEFLLTDMCLSSSQLRVSVKDHHASGRDVDLGFVLLKLDGLQPNHPQEKWTALQEAECGEIQVRLSWKPFDERNLDDPSVWSALARASEPTTPTLPRASSDDLSNQPSSPTKTSIQLPVDPSFEQVLPAAAKRDRPVAVLTRRRSFNDLFQATPSLKLRTFASQERESPMLAPAGRLHALNKFKSALNFRRKHSKHSKKPKGVGKKQSAKDVDKAEGTIEEKEVKGGLKTKKYLGARSRSDPKLATAVSHQGKPSLSIGRMRSFSQTSPYTRKRVGKTFACAYLLIHLQRGQNLHTKKSLKDRMDPVVEFHLSTKPQQVLRSTVVKHTSSVVWDQHLKFSLTHQDFGRDPTLEIVVRNNCALLGHPKIAFGSIVLSKLKGRTVADFELQRKQKHHHDKHHATRHHDKNQDETEDDVEELPLLTLAIALKTF